MVIRAACVADDKNIHFRNDLQRIITKKYTLEVVYFRTNKGLSRFCEEKA